MGLFFSSKSKKSSEGGFMDVIRCDERDYLVWKWRPAGALGANSTKKENSIRYGSMLTVKPEEVAVFLYQQKNGTEQDFITGPYHGKIETANFPALTSIVGLAFGGDSPFQAEIYFISIKGNNQIDFVVPYFDVTDPLFAYGSVRVMVKGRITFDIKDYKLFVEQNALQNFSIEEFREKLLDSICEKVKTRVAEVPHKHNVSVLKYSMLLTGIKEAVKEDLEADLSESGIHLKNVNISAIEFDKSHPEYNNFIAKAQLAEAEMKRKQEENIDNINRLNAENWKETMRIQREEGQRAQKLQTESNFIGAHALNLQSEVLKTGAENLGQMGTMNLGSGSGGFNPAGMMTGMMMGGAMGGQMANMMNQMGGQMQQTMNTPPPLPTSQYYVAINGQQSGPFTIPQLQQYVAQGQFTASTLVWKQGMPGWAAANTVEELVALFNTMTPPPLPPTV